MYQKHPLIGQYIGNNNEYIVSGFLSGAGGMADILWGQNLSTREYVAIKVIKPQRAFNHHEVASFDKEARQIMALKHVRIIPIYLYGHAYNQPFLVMPRCAGSLDQWLRGQMDFDFVVRCILQIASGLQYAHDKNIVHRDLKPQNVLISQNGDLLLSDFGISVVLEGNMLSTADIRTQDEIGTPPYMAPEQFRKKSRPASDQYSLAIIAFEMLAGQRPFDADSYYGYGIAHTSNPTPDIRQFRQDIPEEMAEVVMKGLEKKPNDRYPTIKAFAQALAEAWQEFQKRQQRNLANEYRVKADELFGKMLFKEAITHYDKAISLDPDLAAAYTNKGRSLENLNKYDEAMLEYSEAIRLKPHNAVYHFYKGLVLQKLGKYKESVESLNQAIQLKLPNSAGYYYKGFAFYKLNQYRKAIDDFDQALELNFKYIDIYYYKGVSLQQLQLYNEALKCFDHLIKMRPQDAVMYVHKGFVLYSLAEYMEAIACYDKSIELDSKDAFVYYAKSLAFEKLGQLQNALAAAEQAVKIQPDYQKAIERVKDLKQKLKKKGGK